MDDIDVHILNSEYGDFQPDAFNSVDFSFVKKHKKTRFIPTVFSAIISLQGKNFTDQPYSAFLKTCTLCVKGILGLIFAAQKNFTG